MNYVGHGLSSVVFRKSNAALKITPGCTDTNEKELLQLVQGCSPFVVQIKDVPTIDLKFLLASTPNFLVRATKDWESFDVMEGDIISDDEDDSMFPQEWLGETFKRHSFSVIAMECLPNMSLNQYLFNGTVSEVIHCCAKFFVSCMICRPSFRFADTMICIAKISMYATTPSSGADQKVCYSVPEFASRFLILR